MWLQSEHGLCKNKLQFTAEKFSSIFTSRSFILGNLQCTRIILHTNVNNAVCLFANLLRAHIPSVAHLKDRGMYMTCDCHLKFKFSIC